jgi:hypothetical protein
MNSIDSPDNMEILMASLMYEHLGTGYIFTWKRYINGSRRIGIAATPQRVICTLQWDHLPEYFIDPP